MLSIILLPPSDTPTCPVLYGPLPKNTRSPGFRLAGSVTQFPFFRIHSLWLASPPFW